MSANIDGMPCPACKNGHHGQCPIWWWASATQSYCTCPDCDDENWSGYDPWHPDDGPEKHEPTDAELEDMARRHFAEKEEA